MKTAYIAIDAHASHCVLGWMDSNGHFRDEWRFRTSESNLIRHVCRIKARRKSLVVEESNIASWIARTISGYVIEVIVANPRHNRLVSENSRKSDSMDVYHLCRLLRLAELKAVYHPAEDHRAVFKSATKLYLDTTERQTMVKQKIKAKFRGWGVLEVDGSRVYHEHGRQTYLDQLQHEPIREQLKILYGELDQAVAAQRRAKDQMLTLGRRYKEIREFQKMPGVGPVGAHVFDSFIQTPHRFRNRQKLWRYCRLGVTDRTSNGKSLGYKRIDPSGSGVLKAMSYRTWLGAMRCSDTNEVRQFYEESLARTQNRTHARLNTQRKILSSLWTLWKNDLPYDPEGFLGCRSDRDLSRSRRRRSALHVVG